MSPKGDLAVVIELRGSNLPKTAFPYHSAGAVTALKIDGKRVTNAGSLNVGALPEGVAFGPMANTFTSPTISTRTCGFCAWMAAC